MIKKWTNLIPSGSKLSSILFEVGLFSCMWTQKKGPTLLSRIPNKWINFWIIRNHKRLIRPQNDLNRTLKPISLLTSEKTKWDYPLIQICFIWHTRLLLEPCLHFFWRSVYGSVAVGRMTLMNSIKNRKLKLKLGYSVSFFKIPWGQVLNVSVY